MTQPQPNHRWVADRIGYSVAGVSLLRSGQRQPTIRTMEIMEDVFRWPMCDQVDVRDDYSESLNKMLGDRFNEENEENEEK